ncbi:MAG: tRNA lysidine(34) synthetase TilS, partial [Thiotrichales bacterium]|nr:tRNA lysidine(34) synthetase TilS [Thiotrichales bacterium]
TSVTLSRVAAHQASASSLLRALAEIDYAQLGCDDVRRIRIQPLRDLGRERAINCLRYWFEINAVARPGQAHIQQIMRDLVEGREDNNAVVNWGNIEIRKHKDELWILDMPADLPVPDGIAWNTRQPLELSYGTLTASRVAGAGILEDCVADHQLEVRFRHGGERIRPSGRKHTRDLKKLFQDESIAPWVRERIPLIYIDDELVAIPGICVAEGFAAMGSEPGLEIIWEYDN